MPILIEEKAPFVGVPKEIHDREIPEALVRAAGIAEDQDTSKMNLADVAIQARKSDGEWQVLVIDPKNPPSTPTDLLGYFTIDDVSLTAEDVLRVAETWIRDSEYTEWMPGSVVVASDRSDDVSALGFLLVRAPLRT